MTDEQKQDFTRRITNSNRGQLVVVIYEICFAYMEEAVQCHENQEYEGFKQAVKKAQEAVAQLKDGLDFKYPISKELFPLYQYCMERLSASVYKNDTVGIEEAKKVLTGLYASFVEVAKQDESEPLMQRTQRVVAGMTYQKGSLTETLQGSDSSRGFLA